MDPNTFNLDPDPEIRPNLDPDPGLCYLSILNKIIKTNFREKQFSVPDPQHLLILIMALPVPGTE